MRRRRPESCSRRRSTSRRGPAPGGEGAVPRVHTRLLLPRGDRGRGGVAQLRPRVLSACALVVLPLGQPVLSGPRSRPGSTRPQIPGRGLPHPPGLPAPPAPAGLRRPADRRTTGSPGRDRDVRRLARRRHCRPRGHFRPGQSPVAGASQANLEDIGFVPLFVKEPGATAGDILDYPVVDYRHPAHDRRGAPYPHALAHEGGPRSGIPGVGPLAFAPAPGRIPTAGDGFLRVARAETGGRGQAEGGAVRRAVTGRVCSRSVRIATCSGAPWRALRRGSSGDRATIDHEATRRRSAGARRSALRPFAASGRRRRLGRTYRKDARRRRQRRDRRPGHRPRRRRAPSLLGASAGIRLPSGLERRRVLLGRRPRRA